MGSHSASLQVGRLRDTGFSPQPVSPKFRSSSGDNGTIRQERLSRRRQTRGTQFYTIQPVALNRGADTQNIVQESWGHCISISDCVADIFGEQVMRDEISLLHLISMEFPYMFEGMMLRRNELMMNFT